MKIGIILLSDRVKIQNFTYSRFFHSTSGTTYITIFSPLRCKNTRQSTVKNLVWANERSPRYYFWSIWKCDPPDAFSRVWTCQLPLFVVNIKFHVDNDKIKLYQRSWRDVLQNKKSWASVFLATKVSEINYFDTFRQLKECT